jgi:hypothetical protein
MDAPDATLKIVASSRPMVLFGTKFQAIDMRVFHLDDAFSIAIYFWAPLESIPKKLPYKFRREAVAPHQTECLTVTLFRFDRLIYLSLYNASAMAHHVS